MMEPPVGAKPKLTPPSANAANKTYKEVEKAWGRANDRGVGNRRDKAGKAAEPRMADKAGKAAEPRMEDKAAYLAAEVMGQSGGAPPVQNEVTCTCPNADETGGVGILEGIGTQNKGTEVADMDVTNILALLEQEMRSKDEDGIKLAPEAELMQAEMPKQGQSAGAAPSEAPEALENINADGTAEDEQHVDGVLLKLQDALTKAAKERDGGTDEKDAKDDGDTTPIFQHAYVRETARDESEFRVETINAPVSTPQSDMQENISRIIDGVKATVDAGKQEFMVQLKPEFLGKLSIKLTMDSDGLKAEIKASDLSAKNLIANQLPALEEQLKQKGLVVQQIEVAYETPKFDLNFQQDHRNWNFGQQQQSSGGGGYQHLPLEQDTFAGFFGVAGGVLEQYSENSSMEFQA